MSYAGCHGGGINYYAQNVSLVVEGTGLIEALMC